MALALVQWERNQGFFRLHFRGPKSAPRASPQPALSPSLPPILHRLPWGPSGSGGRRSRTQGAAYKATEASQATAAKRRNLPVAVKAANGTVRMPTIPAASTSRSPTIGSQVNSNTGAPHRRAARRLDSIRFGSLAAMRAARRELLPATNIRPSTKIVTAPRKFPAAAIGTTTHGSAPVPRSAIIAASDGKGTTEPARNATTKSAGRPYCKTSAGSIARRITRRRPSRSTTRPQRGFDTNVRIDPQPPPGFRLADDFLSEEEERALLSHLEARPFEQVKMRGMVAKRTVLHFGWRYGYESSRIERTDPIPPWLASLRDRAAAWAGIEAASLEQCLVNRYPPGAGIGWHRDAPTFGPAVVGVSLLAPCRFHLRLQTPEQVRVHRTVLPPRSAYVLEGEARTEWQHRVPPVANLRYSLTFRTVREPERWSPT